MTWLIKVVLILGIPTGMLLLWLAWKATKGAMRVLSGMMVVIVLLFAVPVFGVDGYHRKNGTYVAPYTRSVPDRSLEQRPMRQINPYNKQYVPKRYDRRFEHRDSPSPLYKGTSRGRGLLNE